MTATSIAQNPSAHAYTTPGSYTVKLTASGAGGTVTKTATTLISVSVAPPVANFTMTPTTGVAPLSVSFSNTSTTTGAGTVTWLWNFGDNTTSTAKNPPAHSYRTPGIYTVKLTATGPGGSNTKTYVVNSLVRWSETDFNRDGISDLVLKSSNNEIGVWAPDAVGTLRQWMPINGGVSFGSWVVVGVGDFNVDGIPDLLIRNAGYMAAWCPDASGNFKQWMSIAGGEPL